VCRRAASSPDSDVALDLTNRRCAGSSAITVFAVGVTRGGGEGRLASSDLSKERHILATQDGRAGYIQLQAPASLHARVAFEDGGSRVRSCECAWVMDRRLPCHSRSVLNGLEWLEIAWATALCPRRRTMGGRAHDEPFGVWRGARVYADAAQRDLGRGPIGR